MIKKLLLMINNSNKKKILIVFLFSIFVASVEMLSLGSIPLFFNVIIEPENFNNIFTNYIDFIQIDKFSQKEILFYSSIIIIFVFILKNMLITLYILFETNVTKDIRIDTTKKLYKHYLSLPINFHIKNNPSYLVRNITIETQTACKLIEIYLKVFRETLIVLFIFLSVAFLNFKFFIFNISFFFLIACFYYLLIKSKASKRGNLVLQHKGEKLKILNSTLQSIKSIKISLAEHFVYKVFTKHYEQEERHRRWVSIISQFPRLFFEIVAITLICSISILYASFENPKVGFLSFITFFSACIIRIIPAFSSIISSINIINYKNPGGSLVSSEISKFNSRSVREKSIIKSRENLVSTIEKITFKNVSFSHGKNLIFDKFNFTFEKNKIYGIVGKSGSGKSTLLDLITSLVKINSGQILVNEKYNLDQVKLDIRNMTGYVPQKIHLYDDTLKNNITLGVENNIANLDTLKQYIDDLDLFEDTTNLSKTLEMNIANDGSNLSGGQVQRIGLVRALYKKPDFIILDEFTSALDNKNEAAILKLISSLKLNKIIIIISHKLTPLKICDEIINLDKL